MVKSQISSYGVQKKRNLQGKKYKEIAKNDLLPLKIRNGQIDAYCINMYGENTIIKIVKSESINLTFLASDDFVVC